MPQTCSRRNLLSGSAALLLVSAIPGLPRASATGIHVMKDPNCGCCTSWIDTLEEAGFAVTTEASTGTALMKYKLKKGIPQDMAACHTGQTEGYMIEGHVPAADIQRLLKERPEAIGLAVPGMPYGSPGMGPENEREAYDVMLIRKDGSTQVFSSYEAA